MTSATNYYVYAYVSAVSVVTLETSTTGHATDSTAGNVGTEIKAADASRTLVGLVRPNAAVNFVNSVTQRLVLNWFNRRPLSMFAVFGGNATTASGSLVELDTDARIEFLAWGLDAALLWVHSRAYTGLLTARAWLNLNLDGTSLGEFRSLTGTAVVNTEQTGVHPYATIPSEANHTAYVYGAAPDGGTATFIGGAAAKGGVGGIIYG